MAKIIAIIQSRLGSTRLPNKALLQIPPESGMSMLEMVVRKCLLATRLDDVAVVTPDRFIDNLASRWNVKSFMPFWNGRDVVREFYEAAKSSEADVVVRITADCALIRPDIIDQCVEKFLENDVDICFNTDESTGQLEGEGSDVECFSFEALKQAYYNAENEEREHVTLYIRKNLKTLFVPIHALGIRSVNTIEDYKFVCDYVRFYKN